MSFFSGPIEEGLDHVATNMAKSGEFDDRYAAIQAFKEADRHALTPNISDVAKANGFFRVASLQGPLLDLATLLDPEFLKNKKAVYAFIDKHRQHCTYDRRSAGAKPNQFTVSDGKVVL